MAVEQDERQQIEASVTGNVVHAGIDTLEVWSTRYRDLSQPLGRKSGSSAQCEQFWATGETHRFDGRRTGLPERVMSIAEEAYVAGLLFHIGEFPSILGWRNRHGDGRGFSRE